MNAVLFAPHNDDETLFAFYQCLRHKPLVVIVLRSYRQWTNSGPSYMTRETETGCALGYTECEHEQWVHSDLHPQWDEIAQDITDLVMHRHPDIVIAPAWEMGGHEDHNAVAGIVAGLTDHEDFTLIRYYTYQRGYGRSQKGVPVEEEDGWREKKLDALACYRSQIARPDCAPWFPGGEYEQLGEWVA